MTILVQNATKRVEIYNEHRGVSVVTKGVTGPAGILWDNDDWAIGKKYTIGVAILHGGSSYRVITSHVADSPNEPGAGEDWGDYWKILASAVLPIGPGGVQRYSEYLQNISDGSPNESDIIQFKGGFYVTRSPSQFRADAGLGEDQYLFQSGVAVDNTIPRFDGASGAVQSSLASLSDDGILSGIASVDVSGGDASITVSGDAVSADADTLTIQNSRSAGDVAVMVPDGPGTGVGTAIFQGWGSDTAELVIGRVNVIDALIGDEAAATQPYVDAAIAHFTSRALAQAGRVATSRLSLLHGGFLLHYVYDENGTALETADGRKWSPDLLATINHFGAAPGASASVNTAAANACLAWRNTAFIFGGAGGTTYDINDALRVDDYAGLSGAVAATIGGIGAMPILRQTDLTKSAIQVRDTDTTSQYKFRPRIENLEIQYTTGSAAAQGGKAIDLRQCNEAVVKDIVIDGSDYGVHCERVVQSQFQNIYFRTALRASANHAESFFTFDHDGATLSGTSFGNDVIDCEAQPTLAATTIKQIFDLKAVDGLTIIGGHYNNAQRHIRIRPDGTGGRTTVRDVTAAGVYWDCNNPTETPLLRLVYIDPITSGSVVIFGIHVSGCRIHSKEGMATNVFRLSGNSGDYAGLSYISDVSFIGNHFAGFGAASGINFSMHADYDERDYIRNIVVRDNVIRDGGDDQSHTTANSNFLVIAGRNISVGGNTYRGNWADDTAAVITVGGDSDLVLLAPDTFYTNRTGPAGATANGNISISGSATNWRSFGHVTKQSGPGSILGVVEIVEQGSTSDGDYTVDNKGHVTVTKKVSLTGVAVTTATGNVFRSTAQSLGNWPITFTATPVAVTSLRVNGSYCWHSQGADPTTTAAPTIILMNGSSVGSASAEIKIIAIGTKA